MSDESVTVELIMNLVGDYAGIAHQRAQFPDFDSDADKMRQLHGEIESALTSLIASRDQAVKERDALKNESACEYARHLKTIDDRDYFEEQIQNLHQQLGGNGEWSSEHDLSVEYGEMLMEVLNNRDAALLRVKELGTECDAAKALLNRLKESK